MIYNVQEEINATCDALGIPRTIIDPNKPYYICRGEWSDGEILFNDELFNARDVYDMCESENPTDDEIADACRALSDECLGESVKESDLSALFFQIPNEEPETAKKEKDDRYELARFIYDYFEANVDRLPRFANLLFYLIAPKTTAIGAARSSNVSPNLWHNFCETIADAEGPKLYELREIVKLIKSGYFDF